jgi:P-type Cu+ transporter
MPRLPRIASVATNVGNHRVTVGFDPHQTSANAIRAVDRAGYGAAQVDAGAGPAAAPVDDDVEERYLSQAWSRLTSHRFQPRAAHDGGADPGYLAIVAVLAFPAFSFAAAGHRFVWRALTNRTPKVDVLISMGSLPPYFIGMVGFAARPRSRPQARRGPPSVRASARSAVPAPPRPALTGCRRSSSRRRWPCRALGDLA